MYCRRRDPEQLVSFVYSEMPVLGWSFITALYNIIMSSYVHRFGVRCEGAEGKALWNTFVKNKDGTVDFKEFIRVFASRPNTADGRYTMHH